MLSALDPLLASFARLLVKRGVLFPALAERLKAHYLKAAQCLADEKPTDSRLSLLTGLQRRDIAQLKKFTPKARQPNHLTRLVALWQSEPGYHNAGKPVALNKNGPAPSFEALAKMVRRDVHPRSMLDMLVMTETVTLEPATNRTILRKTSYQPAAGSQEQLAYLVNNVSDHLDAAAKNIDGCQPPFFERAVHYEGLTIAQLEALETEFATGQMALLEALSKKAAEMKKLDKATGAYRFRAGGYYFDTAKRYE